MVIPHTEKKILNLHINLYTLTAALGTVLLIVAVSTLSLVGKSGEAIEYYDMGLTNSQFSLQTTRIAEEALPLHETVQRYANTIASMYLKLDGSESEVMGQGGLAQAVLDKETETIRKLAEECRAAGENCSQQQTDEILKRVIYLSNQDNQSLTKAYELSEKVLAELKTKEKQNLLKNTPGIWPVEGYIVSPFGWQTDPVRGKHIFRQGIEIGAPPGSEVSATAPGTVSDIVYSKTYGLGVWITHKFGIRTFYGHLDRVQAEKGDKVNRGQIIGLTGKTGSTAVSMLYYEVHVGTVAYNPHAFLNHIQDQWLTKTNP